MCHRWSVDGRPEVGYSFGCCWRNTGVRGAGGWRRYNGRLNIGFSANKQVCILWCFNPVIFVIGYDTERYSMRIKQRRWASPVLTGGCKIPPDLILTIWSESLFQNAQCAKFPKACTLMLISCWTGLSLEAVLASHWSAAKMDLACRSL